MHQYQRFTAEFAGAETYSQNQGHKSAQLVEFECLEETFPDFGDGGLGYGLMDIMIEGSPSTDRTAYTIIHNYHANLTVYVPSWGKLTGSQSTAWQSYGVRVGGLCCLPFTNWSDNLVTELGSRIFVFELGTGRHRCGCCQSFMARD